MNVASATPKVCLTIAGLDPSGGAGIIADIKTFHAFGCYAAAAVSSITFQNTTGVFGVSNQTAETVRKQVEPVFEDFDVAAMKTGMLPTSEVIEETARLIARYGCRNIVIDPVVRSTSGFDLIDDAALRSLTENLFPLADIVTPNIPETERITRMKLKSYADINTAGRLMQSMGARNVLIKGGHLSDLAFSASDQRIGSGTGPGEGMARDFLFIDEERHTFESNYIQTTATHGTGCTLAAAIAANMALGNDLINAVAIAKDFVTEAIRTAPQMGHGHPPVNRFVKIK